MNNPILYIQSANWIKHLKYINFVLLNTDSGIKFELVNFSKQTIDYTVEPPDTSSQYIYNAIIDNDMDLVF
jgi:hypothetical protein